MKILLADDAQSNRQLAATILSHEGHLVVECRDGQAVLALVDSAAFDLLVIDLVMPRLDGFATIEILRRQGVRTPILVLSAYLFEDSRQRAFEVGANGFLGKPYRRAELMEAIVELTKGMVPSGAREPGAAAPDWG